MINCSPSQAKGLLILIGGGVAWWATSEYIEESNSESDVHETVSYRIHTWGEICNELDEWDAERTNHLIEFCRTKEIPCIHNVERCPANEKLGNNYTQHLYDPFLPSQGFGHVASTENCRSMWIERLTTTLTTFLTQITPELTSSRFNRSFWGAILWGRS